MSALAAFARVVVSAFLDFKHSYGLISKRKERNQQQKILKEKKKLTQYVCIIIKYIHNNGEKKNIYISIIKRNYFH